MHDFIHQEGIDALLKDGAKANMDALVDRLKEKAAAALILHEPGNLDDQVDQLLSEGWTLTGTEVVGGKRIRYLEPPPGQALGSGASGAE